MSWKGCKTSLLSRHLPGGTEEFKKSLEQDSLCLGLNPERSPPEYKSAALPLQSKRSATLDQLLRLFCVTLNTQRRRIYTKLSCLVKLEIKCLSTAKPHRSR